MKRLIALCMAILLIGCAGQQVCRYTALANYGWSVEEGYATKIVLYTTTLPTQIASLGIWNGHVLVMVEKDGNIFWVYGFPPGLSEEPEYPLGKFCWVMNLGQYMDYLGDYKYLSKQPYVERKEWPLCKSLTERKAITIVKGERRWQKVE